MNLPPPNLPSSITLSPTPCSSPTPCPAFCNWMDVLLLCSVVVGAVSTTLLLFSGLLIYRQKESCLFSSYTETLKKSIEKMFCKEQLNIYILHFHEDCGDWIVPFIWSIFWIIFQKQMFFWKPPWLTVDYRTLFIEMSLTWLEIDCQLAHNCDNKHQQHGL